MMKQPLGYQQQSCSCWITSMMNGMLFLLGNSDKISNELARIIYAGSSGYGTRNDQASDLLCLINNNKIPINCECKEKEEVSRNLIRKSLKDDAVIISDTMSGDHSILLTKMEGDFIFLFDPWWKNIRTMPFESEGKFQRITNKNYYNGKVHIEELFGGRYLNEKHTPFTMGAVSSRYVVIMEKNSKED